MRQKIAVITGAANGIGRALALECAKRGISLVLADIDGDGLENTLEQCQHYPIKRLAVITDVSSMESVEQLSDQAIAQFGTIDYLFNIAGLRGPMAPLWELASEHLQQLMVVNVYGQLHMIKAFMPHLLKQTNSSHIINMGSVFSLCSCSLFSAYAMSKHAVIALSESLYHDLSKLDADIAVSVVCPSFTNTQFFQDGGDKGWKSSVNQALVDLTQFATASDELACNIMESVDAKQFYIIPQASAKRHSAHRQTDIKNNQPPSKHTFERILSTLTEDLC